jgi:hypothetical protein
VDPEELEHHVIEKEPTVRRPLARMNAGGSFSDPLVHEFVSRRSARSGHEEDVVDFDRRGHQFLDGAVL